MVKQWPNHYKVLQNITKMVEDKKKGLGLEQYSVYAENQEEHLPVVQEGFQESPEKKNVRIVSKKKKGHHLPAKAYKSIEKGTDSFRDMKSTLDPVSHKLFMKEESPKKKKVHRYL